MEVQQIKAAEAVVALRQQQAEVVLISMPFGPLLYPSIGLGLLKGALTSHHLSTKVLYFTLRFAELIGTPLYHRMANGEPVTYDLVGEWIFSESLFGSTRFVVEGYIEDVLRGRSPAHKGIHNNQKPVPETFIQDVLSIRCKVESFLAECVEEVVSYGPTIVGFTSVFQQQVSTLSLAKRIKARVPETFIVLGGANCEGVMGAEVIRQFSFVDAVVSGEGDIVFPELVQKILAGEPVYDLQGVYTRDSVGLVPINGHYPNAPSVRNMNTLPFPDFDDFFQQWEEAQLNTSASPRLTFETSRGCWWGEKNHCTFCGLNGATMMYRSKSGSRALNELLYFTQRYPNCPVSVVDNILDMKYFKDFVPELAMRQLDLDLFYEVKANLKKEQVQLLRDAGITRLQPGIESLSNRVLELMKKGVKGLQNIQLLKWCKELGVKPSWNLLWGFPGESPEEYEHMAKLIPLLSHLPPPSAAATIRLDRFSPNFDDAEQFGFVDVVPYPAYNYIYPLASEHVTNLAYYFTFQYREKQDVEAYTKPIAEQVAVWQETYHESDLFSVDKGTHLLIWDFRPIAYKPLTVLTGIQRSLYLTCDCIRAIGQLQQLVEEQASGGTEVGKLLQSLVERHLMIHEGNSYLSLAIPLGEYAPNKAVLERFYEAVKILGKTSRGEFVIPFDEDT